MEIGRIRLFVSMNVYLMEKCNTSVLTTYNKAFFNNTTLKNMIKCVLVIIVDSINCLKYIQTDRKSQLLNHMKYMFCKEAFQLNNKPSYSKTSTGEYHTAKQYTNH